MHVIQFPRRWEKLLVLEWGKEAEQAKNIQCPTPLLKGNFVTLISQK